MTCLGAQIEYPSTDDALDVKVSRITSQLMA